MKLFQRIFFAAVLSGLAAGLAMSALQYWKVTPLILAAETYENAAPQGADGHAQAHAAAAEPHVHEADAWAPQDGLERTAYTVLANLLAAMGYGLLLAAVSLLSGLPITARNGIVWGLGGFLAVQLAPALGLPPELPGMPAADLGARQLWWLGTAVATGAALLGIAKFRNLAALGIGAILLLLPHLIGAPHLTADAASSVPAGLATSFAASALAVGACFWLILGSLLGWVDERLARSPSFALKGAHA